MMTIVILTFKPTREPMVPGPFHVNPFTPTDYLRSTVLGAHTWYTAARLGLTTPQSKISTKFRFDATSPHPVSTGSRLVQVLPSI